METCEFLSYVIMGTVIIAIPLCIIAYKLGYRKEKRKQQKHWDDLSDAK